MLSMTSDYATSSGCPEPSLRRIAEAGFSHVHWCHQWDTDFLYSPSEVEQIARWMRDLGLALTDLHGSSGREKGWGSPRDYERLAGIDLVSNRIAMTARLGADVVIMHLPTEPDEPAQREPYWARLRASLDALQPVARDHGVRLALENGGSKSFDTIGRVFALYGPDYVGLCYDSGHGNVAGDGLGRLERLADRLISLHLHDNDASADQHKLLFDGTVDWPRLARIIAASPYRKPVSMESNLRSYPEDTDEADFLARAFRTGTAFAGMVARH